MTCSLCGRSLEADAKFCDKCGTPTAEAFNGCIEDLLLCTDARARPPFNANNIPQKQSN